jgi:4'-phosphopantetheinyl transferase EntD
MAAAAWLDDPGDKAGYKQLLSPRERNIPVSMRRGATGRALPAMIDPVDTSLQAAMGALCVRGIETGHRLISPGDENSLMAVEEAAFAASVVKVRRASGAARIVARGLLARLGYTDWALPKSPTGAPAWPAEVVGSLAHDARVAVAAVGLRRHIAAVGIDVEPAEALPFDLLGMIATPTEQRQIADDPHAGRLLFAAKEAVYKAVHPLDQVFLEHHDVEVSLADRKAVVRINGRVVELRFCVSSHLVALAFISAPQPDP